jgi:hypothetical protein
VADAVQFSTSIDEFVSRADATLNGLPVAVGYEALATLKEHTPVVTGNLRASWTLDIQDRLIRIYTGVVYALRVELGFVGKDSAGREYHQHGRGMVQQTQAELPGLVARVVRRLKGQPE